MLSGDLALLDLLEATLDSGDGESGSQGSDLLDGGDVGLGVTLLGGVGSAGKEDDALLEGLEAGDVGSEGLLAEVLSSRVDGNTDGGSESLGDTGLLQNLLETKISISLSTGFVLIDLGGVKIIPSTQQE